MNFNAEDEIENAKLVIDHFGYWPSFHDSEIMSIKFVSNLEKTTSALLMEVYAFEMTDQLKGKHYKLIKHCFVEFEFTDLQSNEIDCFNHQNAMLGLNFGKRDEFLLCELSSAFGVGGNIESRKIRINKLETVTEF